MATKSPLGHLTRIPLRECWEREDADFTPWLAQPENIRLLGDAVGMELEVQGQETSVGPFRADILCKNLDGETKVLIENQLERTDHGHLGQLLTYAAGLRAVTLVWICEHFAEEHRAALDWLNEVTNDDVQFFGLEIELWRIGNGPAAAKFNLVAKPNDWSRTVQRREHSAPTPMGALQQDYWAGFGDFLVQRGATFKPPKPYPSNWVNYGLGRSGIHLVANVNATYIAVGVEVDQREHPAWFVTLERERSSIEREIGFVLDWDAKPGNKYSVMRVKRDLDMRNRENWPAAFAWMLERLDACRTALRPRAERLSDDEPLPTNAAASGSVGGSTSP